MHGTSFDNDRSSPASFLPYHEDVADLGRTWFTFPQNSCHMGGSAETAGRTAVAVVSDQIITQLTNPPATIAIIRETAIRLMPGPLSPTVVHASLEVLPPWARCSQTITPASTAIARFSQKV